VSGGQLLVGVLVAVVAEQMVEELVRAHADAPVDHGHRHVVVVLAQGLPPRHRVQVRGVDQGAVDVEQNSGFSRHDGRVTPGTTG
jgi:hypothetical protein